jgi:hypothetical protein
MELGFEKEQGWLQEMAGAFPRNASEEKDAMAEPIESVAPFVRPKGPSNGREKPRWRQSRDV